MDTNKELSKQIAFFRDDASGELLIQQAYAGDQGACDALYEQLEAVGMAEDLALRITDTLDMVLRAEYKQPLMQESFRRRMNAMREQLGTETAAPLEDLLIERIVLCWIHLNQAEQRMISNNKAGTSFRAVTFYEQSVDRAQKRYLQAVQSLALIRKLQLPTVQVNIADRQINVAPNGNAFPGVLPCLEEGLRGQ